ncbi:MAG TPA: AsmA-like C-terminal domain-containing protein [Geminicoccaceae bacterium]|nr:AsmA-like C-terminal domain-containing protein [Geminicoccus sp.]HMU51607.1 AsmA-like C-terminal domain-containing protein [Geminicoccaceae bacterium]
MRRLAIAFVVLIVLVAVAVGGLLWRIGTAPLSLAWIQPQIQAMVDRSSPFAVTFTDPSLGWDRADNVLELQVRNVEARAENGHLVASAPRLRGTVALAPLLGRRIELVEVGLELPRIGLARDANGKLALSFDGKLAEVPMGETAGGGGLEALLGGTPEGADPRLASLRRIEVQAPVLEYVEEALGARVTARDAVFTMVRTGEIWDTSLAAGLGSGRITARAAPAASPPLLDLVIELESLEPSLLADFARNLPLAGLVLPVSGTIAFSVDPHTGSNGPATVDLTGQSGRIASESLGLAPLALDGAILRGRIDAALTGASIDELRLAGEGFVFDAKGTIGLTPTGVTADVTIDPDDLDIDEALRLWPTKVAEETRTWLADHVTEGKLGYATLRIGDRSSRPGQQDLSGSLQFSGARVKYLDGFPPADSLSGNVGLAGDTLTLTAPGGRTGDITLGATKVTLANLTGAGVVRLQARLDLSSTLRAALQLLDAPPVELGKHTGIAADRVGGRQATSLTVSLPLVDPLPPAKIVYRADARLTGLEVKDAIDGYSLGADVLTLTAQPAGVSGKGDIRVNGVPVTVDFMQTEKPGADKIIRRIDARGQLDRQGVERLGFAWPAQLGGSVAAQALVTEQANAVRTADVTLDLARASVSVPELQLAKTPGQAGTLLAKLTQLDTHTLSVDLARLTMPGWTVEAHGAAALDPFAVQRIELTQGRSPLGDLTASLFQQRGVWRGHVDIGSLDARPLMAGGGGGGGGGPLPDMALALSARSLRLGETPLSRMIASFEHRGGQWRTASAQGAIEGSTIGLELAPAGRDTRLTVRGSDAGWVLRSISSSDQGVRGGTFRLDATVDQSGSRPAATGDLKIRNFTMWGAPTIARIASLASISGLSNALSGQGVPISRLIVPFRLGNDVVTFEAARLVGSDIGVRADGTIDIARSQIDMSGTVAPLYTINRTLGRIPIIGSLMSGSRSDALLAAGFSVRGALDQPQVSVNPLSALVPGFIRDLFGGFDTDPSSAGE